MAHETSPLLGLPGLEWKVRIHPIATKLVFITAFMIGAYSFVAFVISGVDLNECNLRTNLPAIFAAFISWIGVAVYVNLPRTTIMKFMVSYAFMTIGLCLYAVILVISILEPIQCASIYNQLINAIIGGSLDLLFLSGIILHIETAPVTPIMPNVI